MGPYWKTDVGRKGGSGLQLHVFNALLFLFIEIHCTCKRMKERNIILNPDACSSSCRYPSASGFVYVIFYSLKSMHYVALSV